MYLRLWWKDARQFWPIWAFLVLAAGGTQLLMDLLVNPETRGGLLVPMAMGWACLYAFAAGAAAFAGEREAGTLAFLDRLPAPRRVVWTGKVSFAAVTTTALTAVLVGLAAIDAATPRPGSPWGMPDAVAMVTLGTVIVQALAWGLLCSSIFPNALMAAVAAIVLTALSRLLMLDLWFADQGPDPLTRGLGLAGIVTALSLVRFTAGGRDRRLLPSPRLPLAMRLRSPIEVTWTGRPRAVPVAARSRASFAAKGAPVEMVAYEPPIAARRPAIAAAADRAAERERPRSRLAEFRALVGQARREGRPTWLFLAAIGMYCPALIAGGAVLDPLFLLVWNAIITLGAGVSVFGLENRRRTQRFLVHHGARPGLVWLAKLLTWGFGLAVIWSPMVYLIATGAAASYRRTIEAPWALAMLGLHLPLIFSIAVLCGMAIPRGITAGVVALVLSLLLGIGQGALLMAGMLPIWGSLVLPAVFLVTSWAWSGDWLLDRAAPGRWVRLGGVLGTLLAISFGGYTGWRAWSYPDVGPIPMPSDWVAATARLPEDYNAAPLYREAGTRAEVAIARGTDLLEMPPGKTSELLTVQQHILDLDHHPEVLDLIRRAAARPECQFVHPDRITLRTRLNLPAMRTLGDAVTAHALRDLDRGDMAGAWDDAMLLFRMARHVRQGATLTQALQSLAIERQALGVAQQWANAPGQSPDRLRAAMAAYRGLPAMSPAAEIVRAEGLLVERTIGLPIEDLRDLMAEMTGARRALSIHELLRLDVISTPWERTRAVRINRRFTEEAARLMVLEPRQRPEFASGFTAAEAVYLNEGTSLVALLQPAFSSYMQAEDRTEVERRALVGVMAVREWVLRHDGRFPERLEEVALEVPVSLPMDPYTGRPFGYITLAHAQEIHPNADWSVPRWPAGTRLIYSAGPDRGDDHGLYARGALAHPGGDIVFPVLPASREKKPRAGS